MYGHPLARTLDQWWTAHGARHDDADWQQYLWHLAELVSTKLDEIASEHSNMDSDGVKRFGMSKAAGCTRAAELKLLGYDPEPFSGSSLVTFHIGHLLECVGIATLKAAGFEVDGVQASTQIDPYMLSATDGRVTVDGTVMGLSVKSYGYKFSSYRNGKPVRQGFTSLPFEGVKHAQPSWWAQAQAERHGDGLPGTMMLVVAKDIVKAFENDPYMKESGSLTFYCEYVPHDPAWCWDELVPHWQAAWQNVQSGRAGSPQYLRPDGTYVTLPRPADVASGWGGENQKATTTFNPCFGCDLSKACKTEYTRAMRGTK